ncbi:MAG: DHH family phosphoesterase [Eubacteriales bacterium]|nr:DHH family phosphoesterase [Eubacteriales bacterium]
MEKRLSRILEPGFGMYFVVFLLFACVSAFFSLLLALFELLVCAVLYGYYVASMRRRNREMLQYLEALSGGAENETRQNFSDLPMPITVCMIGNGQIVWCNDQFHDVYDLKDSMFEQTLEDIVPGFDTSWLLDKRPVYPSEVKIGEKYYTVMGSRVHPADGSTSVLMTLYWIDMTELISLRREHEESKPVVSIVSIDNYEELVKNVSDSEKATLLAAIDNRIGEWGKNIHGVLRKYDRDKYIFVMEERDLAKITQDKFSVLDSVRSIVSREGINATLSIGIGRDGKTLEEKYEFALLALDMALSRGGDQTVIKNRYAFEFFGGVAKEVEKRTKVKSRVMANALGQLMRDSSHVFVMGHHHSDIDALGAAVGVACAARSRGKQVHIVLRRAKTLAQPLLERIEASGEYDGVFIEPEQAAEMIDGNSLMVVVDTNRPDFVDAPELLSRFRKVAVIDHHRRAADYIENCAVNMHEPSASSASELVSELLQYMVPNQTISRIEAESLLAGIYLDTKGFSIKAGVRTFEAAAYLRRAGADMVIIKRMFQNTFVEYMQRERVISCAETTDCGIVVAVTEDTVSRPTAAQAADELLNIIGVKGSIVAFPLHDDVVVSARSMGNVNVQVITEMLGGGGSLTAAGAQLKNTTCAEAKERILQAVEAYTESQGAQDEDEKM